MSPWIIGVIAASVVSALALTWVLMRINSPSSGADGRQSPQVNGGTDDAASPSHHNQHHNHHHHHDSGHGAGDGGESGAGAGGDGGGK